MKLTSVVTVSFLIANGSLALRGNRSLQGSPLNQDCSYAVPIVGEALVNGEIVEGTTVGAPDVYDQCGFDTRPVYYKFRSNGGRYTVTTCHNQTDFNSQVWVRRGDCNGFHSSPCDALTGYQSCDVQGNFGGTVWIYTVPDSFYIVAVGGEDDDQTGSFGLSVQEYVRPGNDICDGAVLLRPSTHEEPVVVGSTANASFHNAVHDNCNSDDLRLTAFYKFFGTGNRMKISTCNAKTNYMSALALFDTDECEDLGCPLYTSQQDFDCRIEGTDASNAVRRGSTIEFMSEQSKLYTVAVRGINKYDRGDFGLILQEFIRPPNDVCSNHIPLEPVHVSGGAQQVSRKGGKNTTVAYGSTLNSTETNIYNCLSGSWPSAYYSVIGNGQRMKVSTCTEVELDFYTRIHVFEGTCDPPSANNCSSWVGKYDYECELSPYAASLEWDATEGTVYTIAIHGKSQSDRGEFGLSLEAFGDAEEDSGSCHWVQVPQKVCDDEEDHTDGTTVGKQP